MSCVGLYKIVIKRMLLKKITNTNFNEKIIKKITNDITKYL